MKTIYYVVLRISNKLIIADYETGTLPDGKFFLPVFSSKGDAENYARPDEEIIEIESKLDKE